MKNIFIVLIIFIVGLYSLQCAEDPVVTTGTIEGVVYNYATGEIIGKAFVSTDPPSGSVTTDTTNGAFKIEHVDPGLYRVIAQKVGFDSAGVNVSILEAETTIADIGLSADSSAVDTSQTP